MISLILTACVAPNLYEAASPLLNPGERDTLHDVAVMVVVL